MGLGKMIPTILDSQRRIDRALKGMDGRDEPELNESDQRIARALRDMDGLPAKEADPTIYAVDDHGNAVATIALAEGAERADAEAFVKAGSIRGASKVVAIGAGETNHERLVESFKARGLNQAGAEAAARGSVLEPPMRTYTVERQKPIAGGSTRLSESGIALGPLDLAESGFRNGRKVHSLDSLNVPDGEIVTFNEAYGIERVNGEMVK